MQTKMINLYVCPICGKEYKRKGHYLSEHLKSCHAIAWIPKTKFESIMTKFEANDFSIAINMILKGSVGIAQSPIERIRKAEAMTNEMFDKAMQMKALFEEWKNNPIELVHVPKEELHHIYNINAGKVVS